MIEHNTRANAHAAFFEIEIGDPAVVPREIDNQAFADRVSNQTRTGAARRHRNAGIGCGMNDCARLLRAFRKGRADRLDLIDRSVSGIKLARQIIKARVATSLPDFPFLDGSHSLVTTLVRVSR